MRSNFINQSVLLALSLAVTVPFFNYMRTIPSPDWWTHALTLFFLCLLLVAGLFGKGGEQWPRSSLWCLAWWLAAFLPAFVLRSENVYLLPISEAGGVLFLILTTKQVFAVQQYLDRRHVVTFIAAVVLVAALLQAAIGFLQLLGLASLARGYLVYAPGAEQSVIVGNLAQRNQFAQFLTWGMVAAAYLYMTRQLRIWLVMPAIVILALVMAWSGGRLPLAYALAMVVIAVLWNKNGKDKRIFLILLLSAGFILLSQLWGHHVAHWLTGLDIRSGWDRLDEAGFGARRRIEWTKAWLIIKAYPLFGVGFGGFAYQSVWLEAFAGMAKIPENTLFTHSHNLVTQLLAETGLPATMLAATAVTVSLLPYFRRDQATPENAFLILIAAAILGHSMFEYPLWYSPFLAMFFVVLALSPQTGVAIPVRPALRKIGAVLLVAATCFYLVNGERNFFLLQRLVFPAGDARTNEQNIGMLLQIAPNPFWSYEAELGLSNYLQPNPGELALKRRHYEQLVAYRPYSLLMANLAILRSWAGEQAAANDVIVMALATYPKEAPLILGRLQAMKDPSLQPLVTLASNAVQILNKSGDQAVAEAVTKGLPVRGPLIPDLSRFR